MASIASAAACIILAKESLAFEPAMMVNAREELLPPKGRLELSDLDHVFDYYNAIALFYATPPQGAKSSVNVGGVLRRALEELLVHYPWAAGRMRVNRDEQRQEVECNGKGVQFVVAHADLMFSDLGDVSLPHPSFDLLFPSLREGDGDPPIVAIQVTRFKCGGFILSLMNHHAFMDGHSAAVFLQNLCSIARGAGLVLLPDQVSRRERMKPSQITVPSGTFQYPHILGKLEKIATLAPPRYGSATRYSFSANALEVLRRRALSGHLLFTACSRYQALAALLWIARAKSLLGGCHPPGLDLPLIISINIRESSIMPTITRGYVGNALYVAVVSATVEELIERPLGFHVNKIKLGITNVTPECVQSQLDDIEVLGRHVLHDEIMISIPSLVNLPFYDTDCGWGCPVYCGRPNRQLSNRLIILDARGSWNVLVVFASDQERILFEDVIEEYISVS